MKRACYRFLGWTVGCSIGIGFAMPHIDGGGFVILALGWVSFSILAMLAMKPLSLISEEGLLLAYLLAGLAFMFVGAIILKTSPGPGPSRANNTKWEWGKGVME